MIRGTLHRIEPDLADNGDEWAAFNWDIFDRERDLCAPKPDDTAKRP